MISTKTSCNAILTALIFAIPLAVSAEIALDPPVREKSQKPDAITAAQDAPKLKPKLKTLTLAIDLANGSHIIGVPNIKTVQVQTAYAKMNVPLERIWRIKIEDDHQTASFELRNNDKLKGVLNLKAIELETIFGVVSVGLQHVTSIQVCSGDPVARGLVLYYTFDKDKGNSASDKSEKGNHGKVHGVKWTAKGKLGGAYEFDGVDDYVETPNDNSLNPTAMTLSVWVKLDAIPTADVLLIGKAQDYKGYGLALQSWNVRSDAVKACVGNGAWATTAGHKPDIGIWYHYSMTLEGNSLKFFVNGEQHGPTKEIGVKIVHSTSPVIVGRHYSRVGRGWYFNGTIDEVMIFNRALAAAEIKQIYNSQK